MIDSDITRNSKYRLVIYTRIQQCFTAHARPAQTVTLKPVWLRLDRLTRIYLFGASSFGPGNNNGVRTGTTTTGVCFYTAFGKIGAYRNILHGADLGTWLFTSSHLAGRCWFDRGASCTASQQWYKGENHVSAEIHLEHLFNSISASRDYVTINTNFILIQENIHCFEIVSAQYSCLSCCWAHIVLYPSGPKTSETKTITSPQHALNSAKILTFFLFVWIAGSYSPGVLSAD